MDKNCGFLYKVIMKNKKYGDFLPLQHIGKAAYSILLVDDLCYMTHVQRTIEFLVCLKGEVEVVLDNQVRKAHRGDLVFIRENIPHRYFTEKRGSSQVLILTIQPNDLSRILNVASDEIGNSFLLHDENYFDRIVNLTSQLAFSDHDTLNILDIWGFCLTMLGFAKHSETIDFYPVRKINPTYLKILQYSTDQCMSDISLDKMAEDLSFSKYHLSHTFSSELNINFKEYINAFRLVGSKRLLLQSTLPVKEIASTCGFVNVRTYNRLFLESFHITPTEFRETKKDPYVTDICASYELCEREHFGK